MRMNWELKIHALQRLSDVHLCMRKPGDWYVDQNVEIAEDGMLVSAYGNGPTPRAAIEDHWRQIAESGATVVYSSYETGERTQRRVRWENGNWKTVVRGGLS